MSIIKIKLKKIYLLLFLIFFSFSQFSVASITSFYGSGSLKLSEETAKRFIQYLQGDFYSMSQGKRAYLVSPLNFYVTEDGSNSFIFYCMSINSYDCTPVVETYQAIIHCSKLFNKPCKIFAREEFILWNDKKIRIPSKKTADIVLALKTNHFIEKDFSKEIQLDLKKSDKYSDMYIFDYQFKTSTD